jgi:hypothetical protein
MLDPTMMKQSIAHTKGSTLQNGIRQDAGASEDASATMVFSLGKIGMTRSLLLYHSHVLLVSIHPPNRSLAREYIDNNASGRDGRDGG